ncbi:hypothetical protein ACWGKQ_30145 [Streptomyces sp. NPDC054770]
MGDDRLWDHRQERVVRRGEPGPPVPEDPTARGSSFGRGGPVGCLFNGCLAVLVAALLVVVGAWVWGGVLGHHYRNQARARMRNAVAGAESRLRTSAADGTLLRTEIDRDVPGPATAGDAPMKGGTKGVRRQGRTVTVTAEFMGIAPAVVMGTTEATGCYAFQVRPPAVSVRHLPDADCRDLPYQSWRPPAEVAADLVAELRAAVARGGPGAASTAEVWRTPGVTPTARKVTGDLLTARALLSRNGVSGPDCYEFRARPGSVTAGKRPRQACYDPL